MQDFPEKTYLDYNQLIELLIRDHNLNDLLILLNDNRALKMLYSNGDDLLAYCYQHQSFDIAAFLLSKNIKFDIKNFLYINLTSKNAPKYIEHLFNIKPFIDLDDFNNLLSLFSAVMKVEKLKILIPECINIDNAASSINGELEASSSALDI